MPTGHPVKVQEEEEEEEETRERLEQVGVVVSLIVYVWCM